jgi:hypothetical protein
MQRTLKYRGFEIFVDLVPTSEDMFDAWLRIEGPPHVDLPLHNRTHGHA